MRKFIVLLLAGMFLVTGGCAILHKTVLPTIEVVHLYAAPDAIPQTVLDAFTAKTGILVKYYKLTDTQEASRKLATGVSPFDLVLTDHNTLEYAAQQNLLQTLDTDKLENAALIKPGAKTLLAPGTKDKIMPYTRTCALLVHDVQTTLSPVTAYSSLWGYNFADRVNVPTDARLMSAIALKARAYDINTKEEAQLLAAKESLCALKHNTFAYNAQSPHLDVAAGQGALTVAWAKDAQAAKDVNANLEVLYPAEGAITKLTGFAIPASAPHMENAYKLLDFLLKGENNAAISVNLQEESLHTQIADYADETYANMLAVHMAGKYVSGVECIRCTGLERTYEEMWEAFEDTPKQTEGEN